MLDYFEELLTTLKQNRLRAIMTGFSVSWGIFMLILLLGSGKGLQNGIENNFRNVSANSIQIWPGRTSENFEGYKKGRYIRFTNEDYELIQREVEGIDALTGRLYLNGNVDLTYGNKYAGYTITSIHPDFTKVRLFKLKKGRVISEVDLKEKRKVLVLSQSIVDMLFEDKDPIGEYVKVGGIYFRVIGVIEDPTNKDSKDALIPISTAQMVFNGANRISNFGFTTTASTVEENKRIEEEVKALLARRLHFSPDDQEALYVWNTLDEFKRVQGLFKGIRLFVWVVGIMTIIAGIVGVSNIMIILVKERTKEIGIRKAIGATPFSVIQLVLSESLFITVLAGFIGMLLGMGILYLASQLIDSIAQSSQDILYIFYNPSADFGVAASATVVLIVAGLIAGYVPARKAAAIKPIIALHDV